MSDSPSNPNDPWLLPSPGPVENPAEPANAGGADEPEPDQPAGFPEPSQPPQDDAASAPPLPWETSHPLPFDEPLPAPSELPPAADAAAQGADTFGPLAAWKEELFAWFKTLVSAAVYATLIVTFGFQVARVEGHSMAPTLADEDRLIVNKLAYRFGPPRRGDIVMLYYPLNPDKSFVKRVIAEEGDVVKIEGGRVYVNNVPMADDFVPPEYRSHEDYPAEAVREGYYFVMGDHRNNSSDSRHWGEVPKRYIIGRVQLRWWPIPSARLF